MSGSDKIDTALWSVVEHYGNENTRFSDAQINNKGDVELSRGVIFRRKKILFELLILSKKKFEVRMSIKFCLDTMPP